MFSFFMSIYLKYFFLLTPFFILSTFLSMTAEEEETKRKKIALRITAAIIIASVTLLLLGKEIFSVFGITLSSFRAGTGILLFLSAKQLVEGNLKVSYEKEGDVSVVPLAVPMAVGPATTGTLLVLGHEFQTPQRWIVGVSAMLLAILTVGFLLYTSSVIERLVKKQGLTILSKITGLILAALSVQLIMDGLKGFFTV